MALQQNYGTGRRKTSVARVFLRPGKGNYVVNGRALNEYFDTEASRKYALEPLYLVRLAENFDLHITAQGGGKSGQAGAVRLGVARALVDYGKTNTPDMSHLIEQLAESRIIEGSRDGDDESVASTVDIRVVLRKAGMLTRDSRKVERKKIGLVKARKRPQYSKR